MALCDACSGWAGGFYGLFFFIIDAILGFVDAIASSAVSTDSHTGLLPSVTLCNLNPVRCGCQVCPWVSRGKPIRPKP